jgi:Transcriptional regulator
MATRQSLKERQRQEREKLILQTAQEVLLEQGYHDMSMGEIAARVGVAKGTLYQHFASKESLVIAVLKQELQGLQRLVEQTAEMPDDASAKLWYIFDQICQHTVREHAYIFYMLRCNLALRTALSNDTKDVYSSIRKSIGNLLDEGKAAGVFTSSIPTDVMLDALFGLLSPRLLFVQLLQRDSLLQPEEHIRYLGTIYFRGIAASHIIDDDTRVTEPLTLHEGLPEEHGNDLSPNDMVRNLARYKRCPLTEYSDRTRAINDLI